MRYRTEAKFQEAVIKALIAEWPELWWFHPLGGMYQRPGIPDLLFCIQGHLFGLELKNPYPGESDEAARDRATALQRKEIRAINRAGGTARTCTSVEEALVIVRAALDRQEKKQRARRRASGPQRDNP